MSLDLSRFHATFFAESLEGLNHVEQQLLDIERNGHDQDGMNAIFRDIHSLKGSAGSLGFGVIAELAHEMESVLDRMRQGLMPAAAESTNVLLRGVDCLRNWLMAAEAHEPIEAAAGAELVRELQFLLQRSGADSGAGAAASDAGAGGNTLSCFVRRAISSTAATTRRDLLTSWRN
jgi:two-component system, chemotaxis family, sensor kinase CheA